jgi:flagellar basal body rod protein FlgG
VNITNSTLHALDDIAARERDVLQAYVPGAIAQRSDVAGQMGSRFTIDTLCAAPPPDAYFVMRDVQGRLLFTRDGGFALKDGVLVDRRGHVALGYAANGATLAPLRADAVDAALGFSRTARLEADGSVTYDRTTLDPVNGRRRSGRTTLGFVALARFAPGTKLQGVDVQYVCAPPGVVAHFGRAGDGSFGALTLFARASSNVDFDLGLQRLQEAYLALDAIRAADKAQRGVEKTTMDLLK